MRLQAKVAIITGGGRGIGRAIAKRFAQAGAAVVIAEQNADDGRRTAEEITQSDGDARFYQTDVTQRTSVEALVADTVQQWGRLDILVNNAALLGANGPVLEVSQETWDRVIRVNQTGVFICSQVAARVMAAARQGVIINISSVNGLVPQPHCVAYAAAKAAVESITRSLAIDLAPYGIRANVIAPGPIQSCEADDTPPRANAHTVLGRSGLPVEVANVALFLASDDASYITGERIAVDGGKLINGYQIYGVTRAAAS